MLSPEKVSVNKNITYLALFTPLIIPFSAVYYELVINKNLI